MRIWFKIFDDARLVKTETITNTSSDTRTHKIFDSLGEACHMFDLSVPIWLDANIKEFQKNGKTRFNQDNFIEEIEFDYLEMQILEEDF